jgi:hypothetical protein
MKKLVYEREGKELSRAVIVKQRTVLELNRANPQPPPPPQRGPSNGNLPLHHGRR